MTHPRSRQGAFVPNTPRLGRRLLFALLNTILLRRLSSGVALHMRGRGPWSIAVPSILSQNPVVTP